MSHKAKADYFNDKQLKDLAKKSFLIAFSFGFFLGSVVMPVWTHNLESAQIIANLMNYPDDNPMNIAHRGLYSLIIQIPAFLLYVGISEWTLCVLFSGIQCGIAFSTVSLITLIFSRNLLFSLTLPIILLHLSKIQPFWPDNYYAVFHGHYYPVLYPLNTSLYGLLGTCGVLLIFCLLSLGFLRSAFFFSGLFPAIHPTLAMACWIGLAVSIFSFFNKRLIYLVLKYFLTGFLIFVISALIHYFFSGAVKIKLSPEIQQCMNQAIVSDHKLLSSHFSSFISVLKFFEPDIYLLIICFILFRTKSYNTSILRFITPLSFVIMLCSLYVPISFVFPEIINIYPINALMIHRWLNLSSFAIPCILTGLLIYNGISLKQKLSFWVILIYIIFVITGNIKGVTITSSFYAFNYSRPLFKTISAGWPFFMFIVCLICLISKKKSANNPLSFLNNNLSQYMKIALFLVVILSGIIDSLWIRSNKNEISKDAREVIDKLKKGRGMILATDPFWELAPIQLRTNRELLVDISQSNGIYYVPQSIPKGQEILQEVFQVDLCDPDKNTKKISDVLESRPFKEWQTIASKYNIVEILTPGSLHLNLPVCYQNKTYKLYCL